jgi:hypothetical protein
MSSDETTHLDIWGCCLSRDIFGIGTVTGGFEGCTIQDVPKSRFVVDHFFQECSFAAAFSEHVIEDMEEDDLAGTNVEERGFYRRCITADTNKTVLKTLAESEAEWIVLDVRTMVYGLIEVRTKEGTEYMTSGGPLGDATKAGVLRKRNPDLTYRHISYFDVDNGPVLEKLVGFLKSRYGDRIILIDGREECDYINKDSEIVLGKPKTRTVRYEIEMTNRFKELTGCYCVDYPAGNLGDENHRWGKSSVHYVSEYYKYALNAIQCIVECHPDRALAEERCKKMLSECEKELDSIRKGERKTIGIPNAERMALLKKEKDSREEARALERETKERQRSYAAIWSTDDPEERSSLLKEIEEWADKGDPAALMHLGKAYRVGKFVEKDLSRSEKLLKESISKGNRSSMNELFDTLWAIGTEESYAEGIKTIKQLFEEDNVNAIIRMGRAYMYGKGVKKDYEKARTLFEKAERMGSKVASENLKRLATMVA